MSSGLKLYFLIKTKGIKIEQSLSEMLSGKKLKKLNSKKQ